MRRIRKGSFVLASCFSITVTLSLATGVSVGGYSSTLEDQVSASSLSLQFGRVSDRGSQHFKFPAWGLVKGVTEFSTCLGGFIHLNEMHIGSDASKEYTKSSADHLSISFCNSIAFQLRLLGHQLHVTIDYRYLRYSRCD